MTVLLAAGGTAGHINPALAIADLLREKFPEIRIVFAGTPTGMENKLVRDAGYEIKAIHVSGLHRNLSFQNVRSALTLLRAGREARQILRAEKPELVIGTGGYVCYPLIRTAAKLGIPTALHESNAYPGLTVRLLARRANTVMLSFPSAAKRLKNARHTVVTGNPIRADFYKMTRREAREALRLTDADILLLSFGGSLGAESLNEAVADALPRLLKKHAHLRVVHATGRANSLHFSNENKTYFKAEISRMDVRQYIDDLPKLMLAADLLLSRSGAITIAEAAYVGVPPILVPYPYATDDHQTKNALSVCELGGAVMLRDDELSGDTLFTELDRLISDPSARKKMSERIQTLSPNGVGERILSELLPFLPV